jgi:hypothetical protein
MKKMTKQFLMTVVALAAFTACSDSLLPEPELVVDPVSGPTTENSFVLTDANGQQISKVSSKFGTYYLNIKTDGFWYIEGSDNMEFTPTRMYGKGSARVPVLIGNNWATARELSYSVKFLNGSGVTRGQESAEGSTQKVEQESATSLENFKQLVNSNIFVGYGYNPAKNPVPELCTGIEIFKMDELGEVTDNADRDTTATDSTDSVKIVPRKHYVKSSLSPQAKEVYEYADTEDDMDKLVSVKGNAGGNFNVVKFSLDADVNTTNQSRKGTITVQKTLARSVYSREISWASAMLDDANFSDGFMYYKNRYIRKIKNATTDSAKKEATLEFFNIVGTHFIAKALLGCQLDYRMTVDSTKTNKATSVKAALDFKWQQQVKDTAKVDSLEEEEAAKTIPDSLRKNFVFGGKVSVTDSVYHASSTTKADVKARGGEIERVNILTTGGQLLRDDLATWLLATEPEKAAMVGINTIPIYVLFKDDEDGDEKNAHDYLQKIIDAHYSLDSSRYGNWLENQRIK